MEGGSGHYLFLAIKREGDTADIWSIVVLPPPDLSESLPRPHASLQLPPVCLFLSSSHPSHLLHQQVLMTLLLRCEPNLPSAHHSRCFHPGSGTPGFCLDYCNHLLLGLPASTLSPWSPFPITELRGIFKQWESDHGAPPHGNLPSSFSLHLE